MSAHPRHVYFMKPVGMDGPVKIGCSAAPKSRLKNLTYFSPFELEIIAAVPGTMMDEKFLHQCFASDHLHHEWFKASARLAMVISVIAGAGSVEAVRPILVPEGSITPVGRGARPSPEYRVGYRSYNSRIWWNEKRLKEADIAAWHAPSDVKAIMERWYGRPYRGVPGIRPTETEFARLDEYVKAPTVHSVIPSWHRIPTPLPQELAS